MKEAKDKNRTDFTFEVLDWVLLKLQPYRQKSLEHRSSQKLACRYFGPFQVVRRVGVDAYELLLPPTAKLHPVFHVSLLRRFHGDPHTSFVPLPPLATDLLSPTPASLLAPLPANPEGSPAFPPPAPMPGSDALATNDVAPSPAPPSHSTSPDATTEAASRAPVPPSHQGTQVCDGEKASERIQEREGEKSIKNIVFSGFEMHATSTGTLSPVGRIFQHQIMFQLKSLFGLHHSSLHLLPRSPTRLETLHQQLFPLQQTTLVQFPSMVHLPHRLTRDPHRPQEAQRDLHR